MKSLYAYSLLCPVCQWKATYNTGFNSKEIFDVKCPHCASSTIKAPLAKKDTHAIHH